MAIFTSVAAGSVKNHAVWDVGVVIPGQNDTVVVSHDMYVDSDWTIGTSPSDQSTYAMTINSGGKLSVYEDVSVYVRGNIYANVGAAGAVADYISLGAGAALLFDSTNAVTPSTHYVINTSAYARISAQGSSSKKCVIGGVEGGGGVRSSFITYNTGNLFNLRWTRLVRWGSISDAGWRSYPLANGLSGTVLVDCEFDYCGQIYSGQKDSGAELSWTRVRVLNSLMTTMNHTFVGIPGSTSDAIMHDCVFDQKSPVLFYPASAWDVQRTYFGKYVGTKAAVSTSIDQSFRVFKDNFYNVMSMGLVFEGSLTNTYFLIDGGNNTSIYNHYSSYDDAIMGSCVFDPVQPSSVSDLIFPHVRVAGKKISYEKNLLLPKYDGTSPGKLISIMPSPDEVDTMAVYVDHNTYAVHKNSGTTETGIGIGEVLSTDNNRPGHLKSLKSNIAWTADGGTPGYKLVHQHSTQQNIIDPANADYNCGYNLNADASEGKGYTKWPTNTTDIFPDGSPGVNDIDVNPQFVDSGRCLARFDIDYLLEPVASSWTTATPYAIGDIISVATTGVWGGREVNYRCIKDHTSAVGDTTNGIPMVAASWRTNWELASLYHIREDTSRIPVVCAWVRAGFAPTNAALLNAGHDGATIGAMEYVSADDTAPVLTDATATATGPTTATVTFTTDEANGSAFVLLDANATATEAAILAGLSQTVTATGVQTINASALSAATSYYAHVLHRDAAGNVSNILHSLQFTTDSIAVKGATITLHAGTTPQANLTNIVALWWDTTTPSGAPDYSTTTASTDAFGVLTLDLDATTALEIGASGFLLLYKLDATDHRDSLVFAGRVAVSDIA